MNPDIEKGRQALFYFHEAAKNLSSSVPSDFNAFLETVRLAYFPKQANADVLMEGIGLSLNSVGMSDSRIRAAMQNLAKAGNGALPLKWNTFFTYVQNEAAKVDFFDMAKYVVSESASDLAYGAQAIGDSLIKYKYVIALVALAGVYASIRAFGANAGRGIGAGARAAGETVKSYKRREA